MKILVILFCAALAAAAQNVASKAEEVKILRFDSNSDGVGNYNYNFEQSDGITKEEQGEIRNAGAKDEFIAVKGSYSWFAPDGEYKTISYTADEHGFHPIIEQGPVGSVPVGLLESLLKK